MATSQQTLAVPRVDGLSRILATPLGRLAMPSLSDLFFVALMLWMFVAGQGWNSLLADGDTGWHIRTGEYILNTGSVPRVDLFSFTKGGEPWYAWEWLSEVAFALLFRVAGLKGVVLASGTVITVYATILLRRIFSQCGNLFVALVFGLMAVGSASTHFLARPHILTLLLLVISLWMIEADRARPRTWIWLLVPLTALWTNVHGGFVVLLLALGALVVGSAVENWLGSGPGWTAVRRYAGLTTACALSSLANPYGIQLHLHIVAYLRSDWIRNVVQEFQSPSFRSESMLQFEILMFAGLLVAALLLKRRRVTEALWIAGFAHLALGSVRHVPLFVTVAAPLVAAEFSSLWQQWSGRISARSVLSIIEQMGRDLAPGFRRNTLWPAALVLGLAVTGEPLKWPADFPAQVFPTKMIASHQDLFTGHQVLTKDQWADYLIFNDPRRKVFVDGRSDFFGPDLGTEYLNATQGQWSWRQVLDKYRIDVVLVPAEWPLASILKVEKAWKIVADDGQSVLFSRPSRPAFTGTENSAVMRD